MLCTKPALHTEYQTVKLCPIIKTLELIRLGCI